MRHGTDQGREGRPREAAHGWQHPTMHRDRRGGAQGVLRRRWAARFPNRTCCTASSNYLCPRATLATRTQRRNRARDPHQVVDVATGLAVGAPQAARQSLVVPDRTRAGAKPEARLRLQFGSGTHRVHTSVDSDRSPSITADRKGPGQRALFNNGNSPPTASCHAGRVRAVLRHLRCRITELAPDLRKRGVRGRFWFDQRGLTRPGLPRSIALSNAVER